MDVTLFELSMSSALLLISVRFFNSVSLLPSIHRTAPPAPCPGPREKRRRTSVLSSSEKEGGNGETHTKESNQTETDTNRMMRRVQALVFDCAFLWPLPFSAFLFLPEDRMRLCMDTRMICIASKSPETPCATQLMLIYAPGGGSEKQIYGENQTATQNGILPLTRSFCELVEYSLSYHIASMWGCTHAVSSERSSERTPRG